jgi:hypothetical protein
MMPEEMIEKLILDGAVEIAGIDSESGQLLYSFTDKLEEVAPHIFKSIMEQYHREILDLWVQGFLEINISEISPVVRLSERAFDEGAVSGLSRQQQINLSEIIAALRID